MYKAPTLNSDWIHDTPVHSSVETKLRKLLIDLGNNDKLLGIQVCAYKDGDVIIDTSAGVLGRHDPRPVQPDSLFPVFSVTKGITAGMLHWMVDRGQLKLDDNIADIWPEFGCNGKAAIKVHHILNHTAGLHNALSDVRGENMMSMHDWDECLRRIAASVPETEPGQSQLYHYLSFGWLCGGVIEHASGRKFQEILEKAIVRPLNLEGELYIGIPTGVESRVASLSFDRGCVSNVEEMNSKHINLPSSFQGRAVLEMMESLPDFMNMLNTRRAIIPAANGHCSARALARYYAALVDGGFVPPPPADANNGRRERLHESFIGEGGEYGRLAVKNGEFGLGFRRIRSKDGSVVGFGHSGMGGSTGFCVIEDRFSIAITLNKMSLGGVTRSILDLVSSELGISLSDALTLQHPTTSTSMPLIH